MALILTIACVAATGCESESSSSEPRHAVTQVVHELQEGFADRDIASICKLMTRSAKDEAGRVAHATPTTCTKDVAKVFRLIDESGGWFGDGQPRVVSVDQDGGRARAELALGDWRATVPFEKRSGRWQLASFIGVGVAALEEAESREAAETFPAADRPVEVLSHEGPPCFPLDSSAYPRVSGVCEFRVSDAGPVPLKMLTPYGGFKFDDCFVDYRVYVDGEGRTWTDEWEVEGADDSGCSDVNLCFRQHKDGRVDKLPWKGRIVSNADGEFFHRMRMCVRTCVGMFAGDFVVRLTEDGGRWRVEPTNSDATGFKFDGTLDIYGLPFKIRQRKSTVRDAASARTLEPSG